MSVVIVLTYCLIQVMVQQGASLRLKCGSKGVPSPDVAWYRVNRKGNIVRLFSYDRWKKGRKILSPRFHKCSS